MISISIIAVGKLKENFYKEAIEEYQKRLSAFCRFEVIEVKDEKTPDTPTETEKQQLLKKEGERIIAKIPKNSKVITLCVEGKEMPSEDLARLISEFSVSGQSHITFVIGGSMGLSEEVKRLSCLRLSFSKMTFPHMLMRVILAEQLYRAFTIIEGKTYHK